jgi:hypothetical protein
MKAPKDGTFEAGEDSGGEQRGRRGVAAARTTLADLMHRTYRKAAARQRGIHFRDAERQHVAGVAAPSHALGQPTKLSQIGCSNGRI